MMISKVMTHAGAATLALAALAATGRQARAFFLSGNDILKFCESSSSVERGLCSGFIAGISDVMEALTKTGRNIFGYSVCIPNGVTLGQERDIGVQYLRAHPEERHFAAGSLVAAALDEAFPCR